MTLRKRLAEHAMDYRTLQPNAVISDDLVDAIDRIDALERETSLLRNHISVLNEQHAAQIKHLTDPFVQAKMLEPLPPIYITNSGRITELERVCAMALEALEQNMQDERVGQWRQMDEAATALRTVLGETK
jgi:hypothetical protein